MQKTKHYFMDTQRTRCENDQGQRVVRCMHVHHMLLECYNVWFSQGYMHQVASMQSSG